MKTKKSLTEIAETTGLSISHISRIMRGEKKPSVDTLIKIAWAMDMRADEFIKWLRRRNHAATR